MQKRLRRWALNPVVGSEALLLIVIWKLLNALLWPFRAFPKLVRDSGWPVAIFLLVAGGAPLMLLLLGVYIWATRPVVPL